MIRGHDDIIRFISAIEYLFREAHVAGPLTSELLMLNPHALLLKPLDFGLELRDQLVAGIARATRRAALVRASMATGGLC